MNTIIEIKRNTRDRVYLEQQAPLSSAINTLLTQSVVQHFILINHLVRNLFKTELINLLAHQSMLLDERAHPHVGEPEVVPGYRGAGLLHAAHVLSLIHI